jgi:hypothetical protein
VATNTIVSDGIGTVVPINLMDVPFHFIAIKGFYLCDWRFTIGHKKLSLFDL